MSENPLTKQLIAARKHWDSVFDALPSTLLAHNNVQIPKSSFTDWWDYLIAAMDEVEGGNVDQGLRSIYLPTVQSAVGSLTAHMSNTPGHGVAWVSTNSATMHAYMWQIISALMPTLRGMVGVELAGGRGEVELRRESDFINRVRSQAVESQADLIAILEEMEAAAAKVETMLAKVEGHERTAATAQTNATASASVAEAEKGRISEALDSVSNAKEKQDGLLLEFEEKRAQIEGTLQGASKVALAKAFNERRRFLSYAQGGWAVVFMIGIVSLGTFGFLLWQSMIEGLAARQTNGDPHLFWLNVARYLVLAPIIWLTWFAARQYGHNLRLAEDYAFKEAAAHAFIGYQAEMSKDDDMLKLLREYAVSNFGANPIRVLEKEDPVTPLNAAVNHALEKLSPDKLIELIRDAISKAK